MRKNVASQNIGAQLVSATDGSAFTGTVTVYVTGDAGTQAIGSVGSGICTHEGNGYHTYAPAQAETNYDLVAFTFIGTGAVPTTVQIYTRHDANLTAIQNDAQSTTDLKDFADSGYDPATNKVEGVKTVDTLTANGDKTGYSLTGTTTTLDALQTALNSAHGAGSWATATGFSTHNAADVWAVGSRTLSAFGFTVNADIVAVNSVTITGDGAGTPWGPA